MNVDSPTPAPTPPFGHQDPSHDRAPQSDFGRRALIVTGLFLAAVLLLAGIWLAGRVVSLAFAGVLSGIMLHGLSEAVAERTPLRYGWALLAVIVALVALLAGLGALAGATLVQQANQFAAAVPTALESLEDRLREYGWGDWLLRRLPDAGKMLDGTGAFSQITGWASAALDVVVDVVVVVFVGIYCASEPRLYRTGLLHLLPKHKRDRGEEVLGVLAYNLRWWLVGRFTAMVLVGLLTGIGLSLIGVKLAITLALIAAVLEVIPNLGPIFAALLAVLVAWTQGANVALYAAALFVGIQAVESYVITPLVQRQTVELPPAVGILSIVLMGFLAGGLGLFVAAPLAVTVLLLTKMLYVEDVLGDEIPVSGEKSE